MAAYLSGGLISSYCYGPADLLGLHKGDSTMWLKLRDSAGRPVKAVYRGCIYWRLDRAQVGCHISLVQRLSARELLLPQHNDTIRELGKISSRVEKLLTQWESEGLSFYLHLTSPEEKEFLVVASGLEYIELS